MSFLAQNHMMICIYVWTRTHVEEEVHLLRATLLASPRGPQRNRRDAPDKESLCESVRIHGCVREAKGFT